MKYAILDENGNQIQWCNDNTIKALPNNAVLLTEEEWDNRFANIKISTVDKINNVKRDLIFPRKQYLVQTQNEALEDLLEGLEYANKEKRSLAKEEIRQIEEAKTLAALNKFKQEFK